MSFYILIFTQDLSCYYDVLNWSEKQGLSIGHVNAVSL